MFMVELIKPDTPDAEIIVAGELVEGEKLTGRCCPGQPWEVSFVFRHRDDDPVTEHTYWGHCQNPQCPVETGSHWHGVSSHDGFSIAEWMLDHPQYQKG